MKRQYIIPVLGLCAMALSTACSDDDFRKNDFSHPGVNTIVLSCQSQLDASNPVVWGKDSQLGFFCPQAESNNVEIGVAAISAGQTEGLFYTQIPWGEGEYEFYLYSPYNGTNTSVTSIGGKVSDTQNQTGTTNTHLMTSALTYAKAKSAEVETPIAMNLKHALAYLDFDCKTSATYVGWNVKSIQLSNQSDKKMTGTYSLNMNTGNLSVLEGESKFQLKVSDAPGLVANGSFHGYAAVVPTDLTSTDCEVTIMLQKEGVDYEYKLTATLKPGNLQAGTFHALTFALDNMTVEKQGDLSVNLSEKETANCYVASIAGQEYRFKATIMGNGVDAPAGSDVILSPSAIAAQSAQILWQTTPGLISGVSLKNGYIYFALNGSETTPLTEGNAVIAAYSGTAGEGDILWSWHIWVTKADLDAKVQTYKIHDNLITYPAYQAPVMMDRNLGATAVEFWTSVSGDKGAHGLFYQWGRKDPFIGPSNANTTTHATVYDKDGVAIIGFPKIVKAAVSKTDMNKNPLEFYATAGDWLAEGGINGMWGNPDEWKYAAETDIPSGNSGTKSIYDPCPPGYRVAHPAVYSNFSTQGYGGSKPLTLFPLNLVSGVAADLKTTGGLVFDCDGKGTRAVYPGIGFITNSTGKLDRVSPSASGRCDYWTNTSMGPTLGTRFFTDANNCGSAMSGARAFGFGVRCMRDETK